MRALLALLLLLAAPAVACGPDSDCMLGDRSYRIALPEDREGATPVPAILWSHGYRGSARGVMRNTAMRKFLSDAGFALIAAQGVGGSWDLPLGPGTYDSDGAAELAYFDALKDDVVARHGVDPNRIIAAGFSAGGMMTWHLACYRPSAFMGFVPMSGTFWLTPPQDCARPVAHVIHIHGNMDKTVPLRGRAIGPTKQGEVEEALTMYKTLGGFGASEYFTTGPLTCRQRSNPSGKLLQYCLFAGGHSFSYRLLGHGIQEIWDAS